MLSRSTARGADRRDAGAAPAPARPRPDLPAELPPQAAGAGGARQHGDRLSRPLARAVLQRAPFRFFGQELDTDDLTVEEMVAMIEQLERIGGVGDRDAIKTLRRALGTTTGAHLLTPFVNEAMHQSGSLMTGVQQRFLTATQPRPPAIGPGGTVLPQREISDVQVGQYHAVQQRVVREEALRAGTHLAFYHAQDPRMRVVLDVYRRVYERLVGRVPADFHFLRFPGPKDDQFKQFANVREFFRAESKARGLVDDNVSETKLHIISTNIALHGSLGHGGEETFHYFQIGRGQTPPPVVMLMTNYLAAFGLDPTGPRDPQRLVDAVQQFNDTKEGSLFQILVPREIVDEVAYMAHPHGLPHDDELLDDLHTLGPIHYNDAVPDPSAQGAKKPRRTRFDELVAEREEGEVDADMAEEGEVDHDIWETRHRRRIALAQLGVGQLGREKLNDEVTRNLRLVREVWALPLVEPSVLPPDELVPMGRPVMAWELAQVQQQLQARAEQRRKWHLQAMARRLSARTVERFEAGRYRPSQVLGQYVEHPESLQHPELEEQRRRVRRNPEHFGESQGIRSHHETMRIRNRLNFIQARVLLSQNHMLNPASGIVIVRHTTLSDEQQRAYERLVDAYVDLLFGRS